MGKNSQKPAVFAAPIETLEPRRMLSASIAKGVLRISGGAGDDVIRVSKSGSSIVVTVDGATNTFKAGSVKSIRVLAGAGNDTVVIGPAIPARISGGPGDDVLSGSKANDTIDGGAGNDTINAGGGNDSVNGGDGNDHLKGEAGNDLLNGDAGHDTISGGTGTDLSIDLEDRLIDPDRADEDLNVFFGAFPNLGNSIFPVNGNTGGGNDIFGNGGSIFGGGGSIF